ARRERSGEPRRVRREREPRLGRAARPQIHLEARRLGGRVVAIRQEGGLRLLAVPRQTRILALALQQRQRRLAGGRRHREDAVLFVLARRDREQQRLAVAREGVVEHVREALLGPLREVAQHQLGAVFPALAPKGPGAGASARARTALLAALAALRRLSLLQVREPRAALGRNLHALHRGDARRLAGLQVDPQQPALRHLLRTLALLPGLLGLGLRRV